MPSTIANVTFASVDPPRLAAFWAAVLGYEVEELPPDVLEELQRSGIGPGDAAAASDPEGRGPRLWFEKKQKTPTTTVPLHLDLRPTGDGEVETERLLALGARVVERRSQTVGEHTIRWIVMQDPEGNGFCLQMP